MKRVLLLLLLVVVGGAPPAWGQTPPPGFEIVSSTGWTQAAGVATAPTSYGIDRWSTCFGPNQQAYATISTIPDEGWTMQITFRLVDNDNRYRFLVKRVAGTNNDTAEILGPGGVSVAEPVSLGVDIQANDKFGVRVASNAIEAVYWSANAAWSTICPTGGSDWCVVATGTTTTTPALSYFGIGGQAPAAITLFGGQGDVISCDTTPPTPDPVAGYAASVVSATSLSVTSDPCADDVGIISYVDYRCDATAVPGCTPTVQVSFSASRDLIDTNLTANTTYRYRRKCSDGTNLTPTFSSVASATTLPATDSTNPAPPGAASVALGPRVVIDPNDLPSVKLTLASEATDNVRVEGYVVEMGAQSDCSDCAAICTIATFSEFPILISGGVNATCPTTIPYGVTRYFRVKAVDAIPNSSPYTTTVGITTPASYHSAAPAKPTVVAKPTVIQKPAIVEEEPVP